MDAYLDIILLPDPDIELAHNHLLNALYAKLHRGLVNHGAGDIGVSFPRHSDTGLGDTLRLHSTAATLATFIAADWLTGIRDHCRQSGIRPVPADADHCTVRRVQAQSNPERLRRRLMRRKSIDAEQAKQAIPDSTAQILRQPFVVLKSQSTGQQFPLFIEHSPPQPQPQPGQFSAYGLSKTATIPWF